MPYDNRVAALLEQLAPQRDQFRSAVATAAEELRGELTAYRNSTDNDAERAAFELGRFARGRIDPAIFAQVFGPEHVIAPAAVTWVERAEAVLRDVASTTHLLQHVRVQQGGSLYAAVERALAKIGRAFGAVRIAGRARSGQPMRDPSWIFELLPYSKWTRAERRIALPLVVEVDGADLNVAGLEEFLDGTQIIALVVSGDAPPAALTRLITPNVVVVQSTDPADAAIVHAAAGPAIFALVPESCAHFVHDRGAITIKQLPRDPRLTARGRVGVFQQQEELLQLERLGSPQMPIAAAPVVREPQADDVLAAWLLRQADLVP